MSVRGEQETKNTHRVFKVTPEGRRVFMHSGSANSAMQKSHEFGQKPEHAGMRFVIEQHDGKDPK